MPHKKDSDAFGLALMDFLKGKSFDLVVERDDGYVDVDNVLGYFQEYRDWPLHQKTVMKLAKGRVLDVGCGAGRHALHLQSKGLPVLGIDASPAAIRVCRKRGLAKARAVSIERFRAKPGQFDTVLMMGNNLGLLGNPHSARRLLRKLFDITSDEGRIVAETMDPYRSKNPDHRQYHRLNRRRGWMPGLVRIRIRYRCHLSSWFDYLFVSKREMERLIAGTGWHVFRYADSDGPPYAVVLEKVPGRSPARS
jgi:SAM-dependent methyltransferase